MLKEYRITEKKELQAYFEKDADMLLCVNNGETTGIKITVDTENKRAYYIVNTSNNDGIEQEDDFEGVLRFVVEILNTKYENVHYNLNAKKADGNLSKLCNLNDKFDETFDSFFDNKRDNFVDGEFLSNCEILDMLDNDDLLEYVDFYEQYIVYLESELESDTESQEAFVYMQ